MTVRRLTPTPPRTATSLRPAHFALVAVTAFVIGMAARGFVSHTTEAAPATPSPDMPAATRADASGAGPRRLEAGVPVGYGHDRDGAVAAASAYVRTGEAILSMTEPQVTAAVRTMAADGAVDAQLSDLTTRLRVAHDALAGSDAPIEYHQAILAVRVDAYDADRARVAVWHVGVLSRDGAAPPQAGWAVSTFDLVWQHDDWKVWAESIVPGPAPVTNNDVAPATSAQLRERLAGFSDIGTPR